ncbi:YdcF family protein [Curtobacterium sp. L1-20]|uniref:YdcF family protein n=1 Tax=Curtobacterium sp. L1-20 TaxID=3138181 RepID=UPI003B51EDCA
MIGLVLGAVFLAAYLVGRRRDPRMLRNGVFLSAAIVLAGFGVLELLSVFVPGFGFLLVIVFGLLALSVPVLGVALLLNGVRMARSEGRSLGNMLSLILGVLVFVLPTVVVVLVVTASGSGGTPWAVLGDAAAFVVVLGCLYVGAAFVSFVVYSVAYARMRHREVPDTVVVLGSGLVHGDVPPLLRSRLDRALDVYRSELAAGRRPLLVPSGGQGDDEPRSEGAAMAEYLVAQGADPADVRPETASRNTLQNLRFSRAVQHDAGRDGPILVVTNNYHVLRAAVLARKADLDAQVVGSPTAAYYVPSAFLREFVAVIVEHRWLNLVAFSPFVLLVGYAVWESFQLR